MKTMIFLFFLISCGTSEELEYRTVYESADDSSKQKNPSKDPVAGQDPKPEPAPEPEPEPKPNFNQALALMTNYCAGCHPNSPWLQNETELKKSNVQARVENRSMPPGNARKMPEEARQQLLNYF
ncbi:hypothetical protein CMK18_22355 [Candidatus Poribacteria bacterium]|mgnify:CR=1 FL=1|nr:hypothetical protein [Candidatus Poribacteria bacterium]|tara:strand:+ start:1235 stop:1609 length:375 start_codon:yes stop_codon:yes gene_type:complete